MRISKVAVAVLMISILLSGSLFAAGQQDSSSGTARPLVVYYWDDPVLVSIVDAYEAAHPDVVLDKQLIPASEYQTKMAILLAANAEMDVWFGINLNDTLTHSENGFIEPLNDWFVKTGADRSAVDAYSEAVIQNGEIIGVPWRGGAYYTYYNRKVFETAGVPTPDYYVERGEWTWEKFAEVSRAVASGDGSVYGGLVHSWDPQQFHPGVQAGYQMVTRDGQVDIGPEVFTFLKLRKGLEQDRAMQSLIEMKSSRLHYSQAFYRGNLGMVVMGEWFPGMLRNGYEDGNFVGFDWEDWGLTRSPNDHDDYRTWGFPTTVHMSARSRNKEAAFHFVSWLGSREGQEVVAAAGAMPAITTPAIIEELAGIIPDASSLKYFFEERIAMPGWITTVNVDGPLTTVVEEYLTGRLDDNNLESRLQQLLERAIREAN
ncbi:carbohydrate ABC transporter substrate-binding protein, CUT1 family [Alkalispirochaeta americana]|uniref:Carbohydrate ABC transporter substrate-binding protein, CUT1 family n=1 Tax=Alkalispirochaeta americana TaxID=159291 RepID=A0A1N6XLQ3_9SPIO|nr:extracellular solute-binding protein [Alkalispirochaeta americana]SIR03253.1 carbohydrate ABC transporter substrate-binding protein, CUT1 family [Alkalispirochaeta americana]